MALWAASAALISIHAPREGSDIWCDSGPARIQGISIHAPREGSDLRNSISHKVDPISIHAPREGSDH